MLMIFSLTITPWAAFHHHHDIESVAVEKHCTHNYHVKSQKEECLICTAHFEKNYLPETATFQTYLTSETIIKNYGAISGSYVTLISKSLRAPPVFS